MKQNDESATDGSKRLARRGLLKASGVALAGSAGVAAGSTSVFARDLQPVEPSESEVPHPDVQRLVVSDEVREITDGHWHLLTTDRELLDERLEAADLSKSERKRLRGLLTGFLNRNPTERVTDGNETVVRLATPGTSRQVSGREIAEMSRAVGKGAQKLHGGMNATWKPYTTHQSLAKIAGNKWNLSSDAVSTLENHADDPDFWSADTCPDWYPQEVKNFCNQVVHSYTHYKNPGLNTGSGPKHAEKHIENALSASGTTAHKETSWASHFLVDLGNPLHTGAESSQYLNQWVHDDYEAWIRDNWTSGDEEFKTIVTDVWSYYSVSDSNQYAYDLAKYAHDHCATVFDTINNNPDTWMYDSTLDNVTDNCLTELTKRLLGYVHYALK